MTSADLESGNARTAPKVADDASRDDDQRERYVKEEDRHECCRREGDHRPVLERPAADPEDRLDNDGEHGAFQAEEHALDGGHVAEQYVNVAYPLRSPHGILA